MLTRVWVWNKNMVLFQNIHVKARVEVLRQGDIHEGTVRYTGVLVARPGEWIGVELDRAVCDGNNGLHRGVQYFTCRPGHGVFTRARNIRFKQNKITLFNNYRTISSVSSVDATLFQSQDASRERDSESSVVTSKYLRQLFEKDLVNNNLWTNQKRFHRSHLVGKHLRPSTAGSGEIQKTCYKPHYKNHFISPPSISATFVPRPALKRMIEQDYFGTTIPRYTGLS